MRISLTAINSELEQRRTRASLAKGDGYSYFQGGEATEWLSRMVRVTTLQSLTLEQWIDRYRKLNDKNRELLRTGMRPDTAVESAQPTCLQHCRPVGHQGGVVALTSTEPKCQFRLPRSN